MSEDAVVLIDAKNLCYACHWVHRFLSSRGRCTSLLFGGFNALLAMAGHLPGIPFVFVWDGKGETWRHRFTKGTYKGQRVQNEDMEPVFAQIPIFKKALKNAGFRNFEVDGLECDDLIGILTTKILEQGLFKHVLIKSSDYDFYQLASDKVGIMRKYDKEEGTYSILFGSDIQLIEGISPSDWCKVRAMTGEKTDNIPQIERGLGPKTAIKMVQAGLDPSKENFNDHKWAARQMFVQFKMAWPKIRSNYALSHIVRQMDDERIDTKEVRAALKEIVDGLNRESFFRNKKYVNDEKYDEFRDFVVEYEMGELFGRRSELWKLP